MAKKIRIFIVEDDPVLQLDLKQSLLEMEYEVVGASDNGEEAIRQIVALKPDFVLMDVNIKGPIDGIEVAASINKQAAIPIVFLTGLTDEATLQRAKLTMPYGYLVKPFDPAELRSTIELTLFRHEKEHASDQEDLQEEADFNFTVSEGDGEKKLDVLSHISIFKGIAKTDLANFAKETSVRAIEAGSFIAVEDDQKSAGGFVLLSGKVSIMKSSISGKELIVSLLGAGDSFGVFYLVPELAGSCAARAQIASRILWIPRSSFENLANKLPQISRNLASALAKRLAQAFELASGLAHSRVEDRIVNALLSLLPKLGHGTAESKGNTRLFMTRKELADLTGTTPETAIRVTKNLEREGYLDLSRPGIIKIVNLSGLQEMIEN